MLTLGDFKFVVATAPELLDGVFGSVTKCMWMSLGMNTRAIIRMVKR